MGAVRRSTSYISDPEARFWCNVKSSKDGCWEWQAGKSNGYGVFRSDFKERLAHRISFTLHNGPIPDGKHIMHKCDNPSCVRPDHLMLGDREANMRDATEKGRMNRGAKNANARLNPEKVLLAVTLRKHGALMGDIGKCFGVGKDCIEQVLNGKNWSHVTGIKREAGRRRIGRPRKAAR